MGLLSFIIFSVLLSSISAFNVSDEVERDKRHTYYGSEPPMYFRSTDIHPFKRYWQPLLSGKMNSNPLCHKPHSEFEFVWETQIETAKVKSSTLRRKNEPGCWTDFGHPRKWLPP